MKGSKLEPKEEIHTAESRTEGVPNAKSCVLKNVISPLHWHPCVVIRRVVPTPRSSSTCCA